MKEQIEGLMRENAILKRAVAIQHERQKEYDDKSRELQHLKELVSQYQEQLRTLEVRIRTFANCFHLFVSIVRSSRSWMMHLNVP
jgi:uncharacterized protein YlxW (UPF0749 family)